MPNTMRKKMANTIRFLAADMVQEANSGHPGAPMGLADIAVVLGEHLNHNPKNTKWLNRDRLVFSGGHGTGLIYSLLHLWGYDVSLDDLKNFRQLAIDNEIPYFEISKGSKGGKNEEYTSCKKCDDEIVMTFAELNSLLFK